MTTPEGKEHHAGAGKRAAAAKDHPPSESAGPSRRADRCGACGKVRPLLYSCKCGKSLCIKHLGADAHGCRYDHLEGHRRALAAKLEPVRGEKVPPV